MADRFFFKPATEADGSGVRADMFVKASAEETLGAFSMIETTNPPGGGPPLHLHESADEAFYVLEGDYTFWCDDERVDAGPGSFVFLPHGVPHRYLAGPNGGRVLMLFAPGGTERYFDELGMALLDPATTPEDLLALAAAHGIRLLEGY